MKKGNMTFAVELMVMLVVFIAVIEVTVAVYAKARSLSLDARHLSDATILASNGAEVFLAADSDEEIIEILNRNNNVTADKSISITYDDDLKPDPEGRMRMEIERQTENDFVKGQITVFYDDKQIYDLHTGYVLNGGGQ
ncbi:MAG: hypothetical protein IJI83_07165 [Oscillospiraceae bacterium]|nr:hypothetical protein [Oscillospiraceae bacterium]MBQ6493305.1 hypothetical protein [Erysipelotrichaceae bacterium]